MVKQSLCFLKKNFLFILIFVLLGSFLIHNFDSIGQDIGRHLKTGELIWQTHEVPKINLFSSTEPDFPFTNHHWLSEVIFYGIFSYTGFTGLILVKTFLVLVTFLLLFFSIKHLWITDLRCRLSTGFWPVIVSFLLSIFIFISRTEVRPEMFSFVILSFFLFAIFKAKYYNNYRYFLFLPLAQLFWVNLHIYFFIGPLIFAFFLVDQAVGKNKFSIFNFQFSKLLTIGGLIVLATFVNPAGIQGALLPFKILNEYGYSIVENQTLFFLADFFSFNLPIFVFKVSVAVLAVSFLLSIKKARQRIFEILISAFFLFAGFKMLRNLPLYALASFPVMALILTDVQDYFLKFNLNRAKIFRLMSGILKILISVFLIFMVFFVANNSFYKRTNSLKVFGSSVPNGLENAVNFVKENNIEGPVFNNFDIGGYLIWKLYPQEKVFVDNRPEAYSVKFFSEIYKPMQENKEKWVELSRKYGINFIFFGHADGTPWGGSFLRNIVKNPDWRIVYINEDAIILVKNNNKNAEIISKFSVTDKNAVDKITGYIKGSNKGEAGLNLILAYVFYNIDWRESFTHFAKEAVKLDPQNPQAYLYNGLAYAYYTDKQNQELAAENIKKAIDLGLKDSRYYFVLGVVYMNLGKLDEARLLFKEALKQDKNNIQVREFLNKYFNESR